MLSRLYDAREIDARTPPERDRTADLLRFTAILMVVIGHWLVATVLYRDGEILAGQVLQFVPETRLLTWVFQVMPLFFFVGGYVNAGSWERALDRGDGWPLWVRRRARRLLGPLVPVLSLWVVLPSLLSALGMTDRLLVLAARTALIPLWFLVVYLIVIGIMPVTHELHRRFGLWVPAVAVVLTGIVDVLHRAEVPVVGFANYLFVWAGIHQLGYLWHEGRLPRPSRSLAIAVAAGSTSVALILWFDYPLSMVAVQGAERHNTEPPSLALASYALMLIMLVVAVRGRLERWLRRPRVWAPVVLGGSVTITLFLWHMTALVFVGLATHLSDLWPRFQRIDTTWWLLRPVWLLLCATVLVLLILIFRRFEDQPDPAPHHGRTRAFLGLVSFTTGMALIATNGIYLPDRPLNLPVVALALVVLGLAGLGVLRPRSRLPTAQRGPDAVSRRS